MFEIISVFLKQLIDFIPGLIAIYILFDLVGGLIGKR